GNRKTDPRGLPFGSCERRWRNQDRKGPLRQGLWKGAVMTQVSENAAPKVTPRLKTKYQDEIKAELQKDFEYSNVMQIPGLVKIVVNMGVGEAARDSKVINGAIADLTQISGQKPQVTRAKK